MSITLMRPERTPSKRTRSAVVGLLTAAVATSGLAFAAPAQAAEGETVTAGTATWGLSTYLNSSTFGRPNPKADAFTGGATFDATSRLTSWGAGTGAVSADGSATLAFAGTSVNFTPTGGGWLRLKDVQATLDPSGNGKVTAEVSYGTSTTGTSPALTYDPAQAPTRGPVRVTVVDLAGNTPAAASIAATTATWTGLSGTWSTEFTQFLAGAPTAVPPVPAWTYASTVSSATGRTPLPFSFSVTKKAPAVAAPAPVKSAVTASRGTTTKPTTKKPGSMIVTLKSSVGTPAGQVKVTFTKKGKKTKTKTKYVAGKGTVTIPKLAKGTWKISLTYLGSASHLAGSTVKVGSLRVTK